MGDINIWDSEYRFMNIVWDNAPLNSGELVRLCRDALGWQKSTTYNAIRKMCEKGLIKNENTMVSVLIPKEHVQQTESEAFMERTFNGSLPDFIAAFTKRKKLSKREIESILSIINGKEEN